MADRRYVCFATRLRLRSPLAAPLFLWRSFAAAWSARRTPGMVRVRLLALPPVFMTLTVWESDEAMHRFGASRAHRAAMAVMPRVARTGSFVRFETATRWVGWRAAHRHLRTPDGVWTPAVAAQAPAPEA